MVDFSSSSELVGLEG